VNARRTPTRISTADATDQFADFPCDARTPGLASTDLPGPKDLERFPVPCNDCLRLNDHERKAPVFPYPRKPDLQEMVALKNHVGAVPLSG
jgi:hypothetical protein